MNELEALVFCLRNVPQRTAAEVTELLNDTYGFDPPFTRREILDIERVVIAMRAPHPLFPDDGWERREDRVTAWREMLQRQRQQTE